MRRRLPPLNALRAFEAAARHVSLSAAADELLVTHGAVSRQVKALEADLGVPVFRRLHRRIELTPAGEALYARVRGAFDVLEMGANEARVAATKRPLVVSCIATFSMRWLMPRLHDFAARHPDIEVRLSAPDTPLPFQRTDVDLMIRADHDEAGRDIAAEPFMEELIGPVCAPALVADGGMTDPAKLAGQTWLHTESRPSAWADWFAAGGAPVVRPAAEQRFETFYFLLQAAATGFGVAIGPHPLVADDLAAGRLAAPFGFVPGGRSIYLLYRTAAASDDRVTAFRDWLLAAGRAYADAIAL